MPGKCFLFFAYGRVFINYKLKVNSSDHKIYSAWLSDETFYVDYSTAALPDRKIAMASFCDMYVTFQKYII